MNVLSLKPSGSTPGCINFAECFCEGKETGQWTTLAIRRKCVTVRGREGINKILRLLFLQSTHLLPQTGNMGPNR